MVCQEFGQKREFLRRQGKIKKKVSTGNQEGLIWKRYTRYHHLRTSEVSGPTL